MQALGFSYQPVPVLPSKEKEDYWVNVRNPYSGMYSSEFVGKFMVFVPFEDLDTTWAKVYQLTVQGKLGCSAKACTARPNPNARNDFTKVVIIYTSDSRNVVELAKVAWSLFKEGIFQGGILNYKTDEATLQGLYSNNTSKPVSKYSIPFSTFQNCKSHWELIDIFSAQTKASAY